MGRSMFDYPEDGLVLPRDMTQLGYNITLRPVMVPLPSPGLDLGKRSLVRLLR